MDIEAKQPVGTASDGLMSQISIGNVLAVHGLLAAQAERMRLLLDASNWLRSIEAVGGDPVSLDARASFQYKINGMLDAQWGTTGRLTEATERLRRAAREYGHTRRHDPGRVRAGQGRAPSTVTGARRRIMEQADRTVTGAHPSTTPHTAATGVRRWATGGRSFPGRALGWSV
ncbi:hypothetical protein C8E95_7204 [Pseudonocardia autotrophica]|uniref:hypothetical protein n=1 Tax=Pseudonocardia autotrophica TaxID=2074 RepID=UPI00105C4BB5|nr:hypothetical protein [Pseudonocardia autotrophica]TDN65688.1 hypothetical protein C8E95_7204 [Pseudonocardia autotrophica]